jgi:hypothetical protein
MNHKPMEPITLNSPDDIFKVLAEVALKGRGMTAECLLDRVLDEGFTEPIYLNAKGEDPDAFYQGHPNAWAVYTIREWKRVLMISGGPGQERRLQVTETP